VVDKAVILAGGTGTRFLPYTKCHPKEMLAVIDKPALQILVEEVVASGIKDVLVVVSPQKGDVVDFFTPNSRLHCRLQEGNLHSYSRLLHNVERMANVSFVVQPTPNGTGSAVLLARQWVASKPFALLCGDDVIFGKVPATAQLIDAYKATNGKSIVGVQPVSDDEICNYASVDVGDSTCPTAQVFDVVEKPPLGQAPSNLASVGRYVFAPSVFDLLGDVPFVKGERRLTDAMQALCTQGQLYSCSFVGNRFDFGSKLGYLMGVTYAGLNDARFASQYRQYLINLIRNN